MAKNGAVKSLVALVDVPAEQTAGPTENAPTVASEATNGKRGRKPSATFQTEVEGVKIEVTPSIFSASELNQEELLTLAGSVVRNRALANFKKDMEESMSKLPIYRAGFDKMKQEYPTMDESQILSIARMIDSCFTLETPTTWSYTLADFRNKKEDSE